MGSLRKRDQDFPGSPAVKTPRFQCRGRGFDPWSGNSWRELKKKKKEREAVVMRL